MSGYIGSTPVPQATQHRESFTCTEGQTTFNTAGYTAQFVDVYLNGSHLSPADFTATNGSDVVLGVAASADDVCDIISYTPFEVAGATFTGTTAVDVATVGGTLAVTGVLTTTAATVHTSGITMPDNAKAIFGAGSDGSIYSDGTNLKINTNGFFLNTKDNSEAIISGVNGGAVTLYHNNVKKFETESEGVEITGKTDVRTSAQGSYVLDLRHSSNQTDSAVAPYGINIYYSAASPDSSVGHFIVAGDATTTRFAVRSDGDVINHDNAYGAISDQRIKQDITDANSQWDDIKAVRVRNFKKKDDVRQYGDEAWEQIGVIAQELEAVSPKIISKSTPSAADITSHSDFGTLYTSDDQEVIDEEKNVGEIKEIKEDVKQVKYSVLYMKAIKALQEAMTRIETLEAKVAVLEG